MRDHGATPESVVELLVRNGLLSDADLVADHLSVRRVAGRNENYFALLEDRPGYFLKYARQADPTPGQYLAVEARVYEQGRETPTTQAVLPVLHHYDADRQVMVLEYLRGTYVATRGSGASPVARALGDAIAAAHAVDVDSGRWSFLPERPPWALELARPKPVMLREMSPAQARVVGQVQRQGSVCQRLDDLRHGWTASTLTHGDLKWANVVVEADEGDESRPVVKIIDWELASLGDAAWDIGSVFHSYLTQAILALDVGEGVRPSEVASAFAEKLPVIQQEHRAFWDAYVEGARLGSDARRTVLERAIQYCGARLLQSAWEWSVREKRISRHTLPVLQLGVNTLEFPEDALARIVGLAPTPSPTG